MASELAAHAILHTKSRGSTFTVRCYTSPGQVRIEVEDLGGPWVQAAYLITGAAEHAGPRDKLPQIITVRIYRWECGTITPPTGTGSTSATSSA